MDKPIYYGIWHRDTGLWFLGFDKHDDNSLWGSAWTYTPWTSDRKDFAEMQAYLLTRWHTVEPIDI